MDINDFRALSTVLVAIAFFGVCWWAFSPQRRQRFHEAAQLPFLEEDESVLPSSTKEKESPAS